MTFDIELEFDLFCIISSVRDYRLCWMMNRALDIDLRREEELEMHYPKKRKLAYFNTYQHIDELNRAKYDLIANKETGEYLIPELKQVDHLFLIEDFSSGIEKKEMLSILRNIPAVEAVFQTDPNELRSKHNLILE